MLVGKAQEIYAALSLDQSSEYEIVKAAIMNAYELVPEAYQQRFRESRKGSNQTYVEFARDKERLFDRLCASMGVDDFKKFRELVFLEEFKNCLPNEIKTYLEEQKMTTLHQAAVRSDDYSLRHRSSSGRASQSDDKAKKPVDLNPDQGSDRRTATFPSGPTCFYCKKKGHVMAECRALDRKNHRTSKPDMLFRQAVSSLDNSIQCDRNVEDDVERSYAQFVSEGSVYLVGQSIRTPIKILRNTGATQSLILECPSLFEQVIQW